MIYIDNSVEYHMSKNTKKICAEVRFLRIIWSAQSLDLNLIENL